MGLGVAVEQEHAPLGRAAVLAARDDLLARVAALLEIDAADELEVDHLRHEPVDRRRLDRGDAALHLEPAPGRRAAARRGGDGAARPGGARAGSARVPAASGRRGSRGAVVLDARCQAAASPSAEPARRRGAGDARTARARRWRRSACTWRAARTSTGASASARARSAGRRAGTRRRRGRQTTKLACSRPLAEQKPASRAAPGAEAGDVVGELALQERRGVGAARADHAPVGEAAGAAERDLVVACAIIISRHDARDGAGLVRDGLRRCSCDEIRVVLLLLVVARGDGRRRLRPAWWLTRPLDARRRDGRGVDRARHARRARSPRPGCRPACRRQPLLLYEWFRWSGQARQIRAGSYEIGAGTTPIAPARQDGARRRDARRRALHRRLDLPPDPRRARARAEALKPTIATLSDAEVMAALGAPRRLARGALLSRHLRLQQGLERPRAC